MSEVPLYCDSAKIFPSDFQDREKDLFDASDATDDRRDERSAGPPPNPNGVPATPRARSGQNCDSPRARGGAGAWRRPSRGGGCGGGGWRFL